MLQLIESAAKRLGVKHFTLRDFAEMTGLCHKVGSDKKYMYAFSEEDLKHARRWLELREQGFSRKGASMLIKKEVENG